MDDMDQSMGPATENGKALIEAKRRRNAQLGAEIIRDLIDGGRKAEQIAEASGLTVNTIKTYGRPSAPPLTDYALAALRWANHVLTEGTPMTVLHMGPRQLEETLKAQARVAKAALSLAEHLRDLPEELPVRAQLQKAHDDMVRQVLTGALIMGGDHRQG